MPVIRKRQLTKEDFELQEARHVAPCASTWKKGFVSNILMISCPIKLIEEIILNII
jgi:hypothetical protein